MAIDDIILVGPISVNHNEPDVTGDISLNIDTPVATPSTIGGIKIGSGLYIDDTGVTSTYGLQTVKGVFGTKTELSTGTINLSLGTYFTKTITGSTTFNVINVPYPPLVGSFVLTLINPGTNITWWDNLEWSNGIVPTLSVSGKDVFKFYTYDGGYSWIGSRFATNVRDTPMPTTTTTTTINSGTTTTTINSGTTTTIPATTTTTVNLGKWNNITFESISGNSPLITSVQTLVNDPSGPAFTGYCYIDHIYVMNTTINFEISKNSDTFMYYTQVPSSIQWRTGDTITLKYINSYGNGGQVNIIWQNGTQANAEFL